MTLSEEMVRYRAKNNLSQAELGKRCKVNAMTISNIERGAQRPTARTVAKIRIVLDSQEGGK